MSAPRIAIVTGSSRGIGLKACRQLADQDLHPDEARSAAILNAVDTNTLGAWRMISKTLPIIERSGYGRIVNVSSGMGSLTETGNQT